MSLSANSALLHIGGRYMMKRKIGLFALILIFTTTLNAGWVAKVSQGDKEFSIEIPEISHNPDGPPGIPVVSIGELKHHWIAAALSNGSEQRLIFEIIDMSFGAREGGLNFAAVPNHDARYKLFLGEITIELWHDASSGGSSDIED